MNETLLKAVNVCGRFMSIVVGLRLCTMMTSHLLSVVADVDSGISTNIHRSRLVDCACTVSYNISQTTTCKVFRGPIMV